MSDFSMNEPWVRLDFLDSLRFFAMLYVVVSHLILIPQPNLAVPEWIAVFLINGGDAGVSLFFVLSAFSLCHALDQRKAEARLVRNFYIRRFFRIAPLFYILLVIYWIRDAVLWGVIHPLSEVLINVSLLFNLVPAQVTSFVWAGWTVGVMALLYLLFPLLHRCSRNLFAALAVLAVSILLSGVWSLFITHYSDTLDMLQNEQVSYFWRFGFLQHLPVFVCGIVVYRLFFDYLRKLPSHVQKKCGVIFIGLFLIGYVVLLSGKMQSILWGWNILHGLCFSLLVLGLGLQPFKCFVNRATAYPGRASYSMYLFHPLLIFTMTPVYRHIYDMIPTDISAYFVSLLITLIILLALSLIAYRYIEQTGIALGQQILFKRNQ